MSRGAEVIDPHALDRWFLTHQGLVETPGLLAIGSGNFQHDLLILPPMGLLVGCATIYHEITESLRVLCPLAGTLGTASSCGNSDWED